MFNVEIIYLKNLKHYHHITAGMHIMSDSFMTRQADRQAIIGNEMKE
jgi:hypothetical protein